MPKELSLNTSDQREFDSLNFTDEQKAYIDYLLEKQARKFKAERSSDVISKSVFEEACEDLDDDLYTGEVVQENAIEFIRNSEMATGTFSQRRWITEMKKLAEQPKNNVEIVYENSDGSIVVHFPVSYLHVSNRKRESEMSDEQKEVVKKRLEKAREIRKLNQTK